MMTTDPTATLIYEALAAAWVIWNGPGLHPRNWTPEMWNILGVLLGIAAASSTLNQWIIHKKDFSKWWQHLKDLD